MINLINDTKKLLKIFNNYDFCNFNFFKYIIIKF